MRAEPVPAERGAGRGAAAVALAAAYAAAVATELSRRAWRDGTLFAEPWTNEPGPRWRWVPFLHPPLQGELMTALDGAARATHSAREDWIYLLAALCAAVTAAALAARVAKRHGPFWAAVAGLLAATLPAWLRPFEAYPAATAATALAVLCWTDLEGGGRARLPVAVLAATLALQLHLFAALILGPLALAALRKGPPEERRRRAVALAVVGGLFAASTLGGEFWPILLETGSHAGAHYVRVQEVWNPPNLEWSSPVLLAFAALGLLPPVRRAVPGAAPLAAVGLLYAAVLMALQRGGVVMHGVAMHDRHHYFDLLDPVLTLAAVQTAAGLGGLVGPRRLAALTLAAVLLAGRAGVLVDGLTDLQVAATEHAEEEAAPRPGPAAPFAPGPRSRSAAGPAPRRPGRAPRPPPARDPRRRSPPA